MKNYEPEILIYGAGAIGASIGGLLYPHYPHITLLARGKHARKMKANWLVLYMKKEPSSPSKIAIPVIESLSEKPKFDVIIITVKNYDLPEAAKYIRNSLGDRPIIVGMENGVENQKILPQYFSRVFYGVICYNAWHDEPGVIGVEKKGPIIFGALGQDPELREHMESLVEVFKRGMAADITERFEDTVHSKLVLNLTNSIMTLVGHKFREIKNLRVLKKITVSALLEGIEIVEKAGYKEAPIPGSPGWKLLKIASKLPDFISDIIFENDFRNMGLNSMGQDILLMKKRKSEINSLDGYFVGLAKELDVKAPTIRTVFELGKDRFSRPDFQPMDVEEIWKKVIEKRAIHPLFIED